ncbi:MAG: NTP transferase domain-containing protein [Oscillospiraceae bacterium]
MEKTGAVILAAGLSSRMGAFKPLLEVDGVSMIRRVVTSMQLVGASPIVIVTGHRHEEIEAHLEGLSVQFVHNPHYASTQQLDSLRLGLTALHEACDRILITPADVPLVLSETVEQLLSMAGGADFIRPVYKNMAGHPVIMSSKLTESVLCYQGPGGLRGAIESSGAKILDVPVDDPAVTLDSDTPEDYTRLLRFAKERKLY